MVLTPGGRMLPQSQPIPTSTLEAVFHRLVPARPQPRGASPQLGVLKLQRHSEFGPPKASRTRLLGRNRGNDARSALKLGGEQEQCRGYERSCLDGRPFYQWHRSWALSLLLVRRKSLPTVSTKKAWCWGIGRSIQKSLLVRFGIATLISNHRTPQYQHQPLALVRGQFLMSTLSTTVEFTKHRFTGSSTRGFLTKPIFRPARGSRTVTRRCAISYLTFTSITLDKRTFSPMR